MRASKFLQQPAFYLWQKRPPMPQMTNLLVTSIARDQLSFFRAIFFLGQMGLKCANLPTISFTASGRFGKTENTFLWKLESSKSYFVRLIQRSKLKHFKMENLQQSIYFDNSNVSFIHLAAQVIEGETDRCPLQSNVLFGVSLNFAFQVRCVQRSDLNLGLEV